MSFNVHSVAVIGGGPAGLATVYELLHTASDGSSTVGGAEPENKQFTKVVAFEQNSRPGGVWNTSVEKADQISSDVLKSGKYYEVDKIHPRIAAPEVLEKGSDYTVDAPLVTAEANNDLQWRRSAVYPDLYSNVPKRFLRFSSIKYDPSKHNPEFAPLLSYQEVTNLLNEFATENKLLEHFRFDTQVQSVEQDKDGKWTLVLRKTNEKTGKDEWYTEKFDAVIVASGHYSTPYIPHISGLETRDPESVIHSKSFRDPKSFEGDNVLLVGSSLSGVDIIQYIEPYIKSLTISRTPNKQELFPWLKKVAESYPNKPRISRIDGKTVYFEDGTHLENIDKIIFATGYHWDYPFLSEKYLKLSKNGYNETITNSSRLQGLYWDVFNIKYPTLGFVGVALSSLKFHSIETAAAALAGVWSGAKALPPVEEQEQWEAERLQAAGDSYLFHFYLVHDTKPQWVDHVAKFAPKGRKNPLEGEDIYDLDAGTAKAEELFYKIRDENLKAHGKK